MSIESQPKTRRILFGKVTLFLAIVLGIAGGGTAGVLALVRLEMGGEAVRATMHSPHPMRTASDWLQLTTFLVGASLGAAGCCYLWALAIERLKILSHEDVLAVFRGRGHP